MDVGVGDRWALLKKAREISDTLHLRFETTTGSVERLRKVLDPARGAALIDARLRKGG